MLKSRREGEARYTALGGVNPMQCDANECCLSKTQKECLRVLGDVVGRRRRRVSFKGTHASGSRLATFLLEYFAVWTLGTEDWGGKRT